MNNADRPSNEGLGQAGKVLAGLVAGAGLGSICNLAWGGQEALEWVVASITEPAGQIWLRTLMMVVIPLVFSTLAMGVAGLGDLRRLGRIGGRTFAYFAAMTAISVTIGLIMVNLLEPGGNIPQETRDRLVETYSSETAAKQEVAMGLNVGVSMLVNIVPRNPIEAMARYDLLAVIFFAIMFGVGVTRLAPDKAATMTSVLQGIADIMVAIIELAMRLAPYGVAALMFTVTSRFGFDLLLKLGLYVATVIAALAIQMLLVYPAVVAWLGKMNPIAFFRRSKTILLTAFSTSSSSATLPTTLQVTEIEVGVPKEICGFVLPLGATLNMNGTALFEGITVLFIAQVFGVQLDLASQALLLVICVVTAIGAAGTPSSSIPLLIVILSSLGIPGEGIAIVLGVDRLLDMCRTTLNVAGDVTAALVVARTEGMTISPADER